MRQISSLVLLLGCAAMRIAAAQDKPVYVWSATGALNTPRANACAVSLAAGGVLVAGGDGADGPLAGAEWYGNDAAFHPAASMALPRSRAACAVLPDGRVLIAGGRPGGDGPGAEIYDPAADQWTPAANQPLPRWGHTASVLSDGRVLLAGGETDAGVSAALEVFEPSTNTFELFTSTLTTPRTLHAAAVLADDRVLVVGGSDGSVFLNTADLVDLETGEVTPLLPFDLARAAHSATTLLDGTVLIAGGRNGDGDLASSLIYLPGDRKFINGPALATARNGHASLRIPGNGNVLLIGGSSAGAATGTTELYDFTGGQFTPTGPLTLARLGIAAAAAGDGVVLAVGGATPQGPVPACGTLTAPTLNATEDVYLATQSATLNGAHYASQESVVFTVQNTALNGAVSSISLPSLLTSGAGSFQTTIAPQAAGSHVLVAARGVHTNLTASTSYLVGAATTTTLTISPAAGAISQQPVTLSVLVHPASAVGPLRGTVSIFDGATLLGSFSDGKNGGLTVDANQNASATLTVGFGGATHALHAEFSPKSFYQDSSSSTQNYVVTKRSPIMTLSSSPDTARLGTPIVLTAQLNTNGGLPFVRPSGEVTFAESTPSGFVSLGNAQLSFASGFAGLTNASASFGVSAGTSATTRLFKVTYLGDDNYLGFVSGINVTVQRSLPTMSTLSEQLNFFDGSIQIVPVSQLNIAAAFSNLFQTTLTFQRVNGASPTGKVFLRSDTQTFATLNLSVFPIPPGANQINVLLPFTFTSPLQINLRIEYEGDALFEPVATVPVPIVVQRIHPRIQITHPTAVAAADPDVAVSVQGNSDSLGNTPTGTVQLFRNNETTAAATATLAAQSGTTNTLATFHFPRPSGSSTVTYRVVYAGDNIYEPITVTTGPIFNAPAGAPTMLLTYIPDLDSQPNFEVVVKVRSSFAINGAVTFNNEAGVVQVFRGSATTAEVTGTLSNGLADFHLNRSFSTGLDTDIFRFVYIGPDPTVQGTTGPVND